MGASLTLFFREVPPHGPTPLVQRSTRGLHRRNLECKSAGLPHTLVDLPTLAGEKGHRDIQEYHFLTYLPTKHDVEE